MDRKKEKMKPEINKIRKERHERGGTKDMDPNVVDKSNNVFLIEFNFISYHRQHDDARHTLEQMKPEAKRWNYRTAILLYRAAELGAETTENYRCSSK